MKKSRPPGPRRRNLSCTTAPPLPMATSTSAMLQINFSRISSSSTIISTRKTPVYWSIPASTALAEAEVEYHDHVSQSIYVRFPVVGTPNTYVLISTTTPWTLPANLAIAYNSTFNYSQIRVGEENYIVSTALLPIVAEKCAWQGYEIARTLVGHELKQLEYQHPFCARTGKLYPGDAFVESTTGTGFVHIA